MFHFEKASCLRHAFLFNVQEVCPWGKSRIDMNWHRYFCRPQMWIPHPNFFINNDFILTFFYFNSPNLQFKNAFFILFYCDVIPEKYLLKFIHVLRSLWPYLLHSPDSIFCHILLLPLFLPHSPDKACLKLLCFHLWKNKFNRGKSI